MYFPFPLFAILLVIFPTTLYALNSTKPKAAIITCLTQIQCPATHFCNLRQRMCILKYSVNDACRYGIECLSGKCYDKICRKSCNSDDNCSLTKEYCAMKNYCFPKHCNACVRHVQCANHDCRGFLCVKSTCIPALNALRKQG